MSTRILMIAATIGLAAIAFDGMATESLSVTEDAAAYCEYERPDGSCSNSCKDSSAAFTKLTKRPAPWMCPQ